MPTAVRCMLLAIQARATFYWQDCLRSLVSEAGGPLAKLASAIKTLAPIAGGRVGGAELVY